MLILERGLKRILLNAPRYLNDTSGKDANPRKGIETRKAADHGNAEETVEKMLILERGLKLNTPPRSDDIERLVEKMLILERGLKRMCGASSTW